MKNVKVRSVKMTMNDVDVLVVGAGPVGMTLAAGLAQAGIRVEIVDALEAGGNTSRAAVVHPRTLEALESIGVVDALIERGLQVSRFDIRDRDRMLIPLEFDAIESRYRSILLIPQSETERVLNERLVELGVRVLRPRQVAAVHDEGDAVTVTFEDGSTRRASWVIGADGMKSVVRTSSGISFGDSSPGQSFVLADIRADAALPLDRVQLFLSGAGMVVTAPLPGGSVRIVAEMEDAPAQPSLEFVQELLAARGPRSPQIRVSSLEWSSRFFVHHSVAAGFRHGRVLLAGDAAHVHSPAGGQGMNLGLRDAVVLTKALVEAIANGNEIRLDSYGHNRPAVAQRVVTFADRLTRLATANPRFAPVRNLALSTLGRIPAVQRTVAANLAGLTDPMSEG
ncbi:NAD(P)/FAD-dependent oxidoreductase [Glaciihabitans sp. UYNi722]|uniref:FAD-dependent oxidoreductase n=1 Tax=Glaciihabitans sp. UYNi722 TaxID=3156344 RepID=UPI003391EDD7